MTRRANARLWTAIFLPASLVALLSDASEARGVRGGASMSVHRAGGGATRAGGGANRSYANPGAGGGVGIRSSTVNRSTNNRTISVQNRNIDIDRDIDIDVDRGWDHPIAGGVAIGAAAAVTAAAIGSIAYSLPPACSSHLYSVTYYSCGGVWYQPQYVGDQVTYIVVDDPA